MKMDFIYEKITNQIIEMLEKGVAPWRKPWKSVDAPTNLISKIPYRGINVWLLLFANHATTPYWLTLNQINKVGGTVNDGEIMNYETIVFWKPISYKNTVKSNDFGTIDEVKSFPLIRYTRVYNLSQVTLSKEVSEKLIPKSVSLNDFNVNENCENIINNYKNKPEIKFGGDVASYSPIYDVVKVPNKESFFSENSFYTTMFHELAHSTGANKRLKRFKPTDTVLFGSETYSKEELIAEMTSSFLSAEAGIVDNTVQSSASYINEWLKVLKSSDKTFLTSAASKASYAAQYILNKNNSDLTVAE